MFSKLFPRNALDNEGIVVFIFVRLLKYFIRVTHFYVNILFVLSNKLSNSFKPDWHYKFCSFLARYKLPD